MKNIIKKQKLLLLILTTIIILVMNTSVLSQTSGKSSWNKNAGTTEFVFLKMGVSARSLALGEAFVAVADDISSLRYNPAGLRMVLRKQMMATHLQWIQGFRGEYVAYGQPIEGKMAVGINGFYFTTSDIQRRDDNGVYLGNVDFNQMYGGFYWAFGLGREEKLMFGTGIKYASELYDTDRFNCLSFDVGMLSCVSSKFQIGLSQRNISADDSVRLPTETRGGISLLLGSLGLSADVYKYVDTDIKYAAGVEYMFRGIISLRAGYSKTSSSLEGLEESILKEMGVFNLSGLSMGIGIGTKPLSVLGGSEIHFDYGFINFGKLGLSHLFSISTEF